MNELMKRGLRVAFLDLTKFGGRNITAEQWYVGLLREIGRALDLSEPMLDFWKAESDLGPMQRFFFALQQVALPAGPPLVVLIDEIDATRSLPFDVDEFFAGIRECFNRRVHDPALQGLTFCLIGVATPSDLIRDPMTTPFNIGRRIELQDFTEEEALPLAAGLGPEGAKKLRRILYWTGGHPFLTQAVCAEAVRHSEEPIDRIVERMFFHAKARETNVNLADVQNRLLGVVPDGVSPEEHRAAILDRYDQVRSRRKSVRDDEADRLVTLLKLCGLARVVDGYLWVRNRIYYRVFDRDWIRSQMPNAELERQRRAARIAAWRVGILAGAVTLVVGGLAVFGFLKAGEARAASVKAQRLAMSESRAKGEASRRANEAENANARTKLALERAEREKARAQGEKRRADEKAAEARKANEQIKAALAQVTEEKNRAVAARTEADRQRQAALEQQYRADALAKKEKEAADRERLARAAKDKLLYQANANLIKTAFEESRYEQVQELLDESARPQYAAFRGPEWGYWDYRVNAQLFSLLGYASFYSSTPFSPDGTRIVTGCIDGSARIWDAHSGEEIARLEGHAGPVFCASFSPDGARIVTASEDQTARVWDARDGREIAKLSGHTETVLSASFSPDGSRIVTASADDTVRLWDPLNGAEVATIGAFLSRVSSGDSFSPDGTRIVTAGNQIAWVVDAFNGREIFRSHEHTGDVTHASFSPDGSRIVSASDDGAAWVWDAMTGEVMARLEGHGKRVWSAFFSPDGTRIVTASEDGTARVWDARTGKEITKLEGHQSDLYSARFSPDGTRILTAGEDGAARVWDARTGKEIYKLEGHRAWSALFSPDGTRIATVEGNGTTRVWDARNGREFVRIAGHTRLIRCASFSPDGARIATVEDNGTVRVWDARDGREIAQLAGHTSEVRSASFSRDGSRIVTASEDGTVRVWDARDGREIAQLAGHTSEVRSASFSRDGSRIVTVTRDGTTRVWDARDGREIARLAGHTGGSASLSPDGSRIVTACDDNSARVWDARDGREIAQLAGRTVGVRGAWLSPDGSRIVTASEDGTVRVWDSRNRREIAQLAGHTGEVRSASFSRDGSRIVTVIRDGTTRVWDARDGREIARLAGHTGGFLSASLSPDGSRIATVEGSGLTQVWDARDGREIVKFARHAAEFGSPSFSPDGSRIVTGGRDGTARVWDAQDGREIAKLVGHTGGVQSASFSPDGSRIVTASNDSTARVWDAKDGREIAKLAGHTGEVQSASFSPDGSRIVTAGADNTARVWDAESGRELLRIPTATWVSSAIFSPDGRFLLLTIGSEAHLVPLSREAASTLTFVRQESWVADQLAASAKAGDRFAWDWQIKHYLTSELAKTSELQDAFESALGSPDASIAADARERLARIPIRFLRKQFDSLVTSHRWTEVEETLERIVSDPRATLTERKWLALVRLHLGDFAGWREAARSAAEAALKPGVSADDIIQAAIAVRAAPDALDDCGPLLAAVERAVASHPQQYARAATPGALLFRAGRYAEAEKRLQTAVAGDPPSRFGQVFLAMALAKLGRTDEAKAIFAEVEAWAAAKPAQGNSPTNLLDQTWDYRLELELLISEAREMLGLPKRASLLILALAGWELRHARENLGSSPGTSWLAAFNETMAMSVSLGGPPRQSQPRPPVGGRSRRSKHSDFRRTS
jgi:WD40 repeat protein